MSMDTATKKQGGALPMLICSMVIFGTIGLFRRWIPLGSATLAAVRGFVGAAAVALIMLLLRRRPDTAAVRRHLWLLILSGAYIGVNWVLLFEAYNRTSVAVATLCYYMAPVLAILAAPLVLKERLTWKKLLCVLLAVCGMVCISGLFGTDSIGGAAGILFGLGAAAFYASVILMNRRLGGVPAYEKTVVQLLAAAVVVLPYALVTERPPEGGLSLPVILLTLTVGIVHTGLAYALYFGSMGALSTQTVALFGYLDPAVAILLSVFFLREPFGVPEAVGVVCILGAAVLGELGGRRRGKTPPDGQNA